VWDGGLRTCCISAIARFTATVDFPTPPWNAIQLRNGKLGLGGNRSRTFPLATATICLTPAMVGLLLITRELGSLVVLGAPVVGGEAGFCDGAA
jgi:hypothetical protein